MRFPSETVMKRGPLAESLSAGVSDMGRHEAYLLAVDCLRAADGRCDKAAEGFLRTVRDCREGRMLLAVVGEAPARAAILDFIASAATDMRGDSLNASPSGHTPEATDVAKRRTPDGEAPVADEGQSMVAHQGAIHFMPSSASEPGGGGQNLDAAHAAMRSLPPPSRPSALRRATELSVRRAASLSLLDTYLVDGRPIGDLSMGEVRRLGRDLGTQHFVLAAIDAHIRAADDMLVRDLITPTRLAEMLRQAREASDVFNI